MLRRLLPFLALAALAAPATAHAGTAKVETYQTCSSTLQCKAMVYDTRQAVIYEATAGEANAVTLARSGAVVTVRDTGAAVTPGPGCSAGATPNEVTCTVNEAVFYNVSATLGDLNDSLVLSATLAVRGAGLGGAGDDQLTGTDQDESFDGGAGRDVLRAEGGADRVSGGDDRDPDTIDGGAGRDLLDYSARTARVSVNLARGTAVQGETGENETVTGVEDVTGGKAGDVLRGTSATNLISGGAGADRLFGAGGADVLTGDAGADNFSGGAGNDSLVTSDDNRGLERVGCGTGRDTVGLADELGGDLGTDPRFLGPDLRDIVAADCERAFVPTESEDERRIANPGLRRSSPDMLAFANPCTRRGCTGRIRLVVPGVRGTAGSARFTHRGRVVGIGLSAAGMRAVSRGTVLAVGLRIAATGNAYAVSYRTRAAR